MDDRHIVGIPAVMEAIRRDTEAMGFSMASEPQTGSFLRTLAATKPAGRFLELGTGTGLATAWLLDGMDRQARIDSVDNDPTVLEIARRHLGEDSRVTFHLADGAAFLAGASGPYDLIFADAWPGKFSYLDAALALLRDGGIYVIDDLLPQANWPDGHAPKVPVLIEQLETSGLTTTKLSWASGLMVCVK